MASSADITGEQLSKSIRELIKGQDLDSLTSKIVRKKLDAKYGVDLTERKKEIDKLLMAIINEEDESSSDDEINPEPAVKKMKSSGPASKPKSSVKTDQELAEELQELERGGRRTRAPAKKPLKKREKKKKATDDPDKPKKVTAYTAPCDLSPALSEIMGTNQLPRNEVVKRMWAIIKERNLKDPRNGQFMICDDQLYKVFGKKRVKTFGMMGILKDHIFKAGTMSDEMYTPSSKSTPEEEHDSASNDEATTNGHNVEKQDSDEFSEVEDSDES